GLLPAGRRAAAPPYVLTPPSHVVPPRPYDPAPPPRVTAPQPRGPLFGPYAEACRAHELKDLIRARRLFVACQEKRPGYLDVDARLRQVDAELARSRKIYLRAVAAQRRGELEAARRLFEECLGMCTTCSDAAKNRRQVVADLQILAEARRLERQRRLLAALSRYESLLERYRDLAEARQRVQQIRGTCNALEKQYVVLLVTQRTGKYRAALAQARAIRKKCVDYKDMDSRFKVLESEVDYLDAMAFERKGRHQEAIRRLERCAKRSPGFRDVDERLRRYPGRNGRHGRHDPGVRDPSRGAGSGRGYGNR
ncbi:MAG: hypothetical protein O7J95_03015, partial [Planctomycetota bacterium]|nr:hypothetical protein [Planctomycetota bacterium]